MLGTVERLETSIDALEQVLMAGEAAIAKIRAHQVAALVDLDRVQVHTGDGARSLHDWVAARLDVTHETAKLLVDASRTLPEHAESLQSLADGVVSFDRALATGELAVSGASGDLVAASAGFDLAGVAPLAARRRRITSADERTAFRERFVALQPNLDASSWRLWGHLPALEGAMVEQALTARAESLPATSVAGPRVTGPRRADAFVSIVQDSVSDANSTTPAAPSVTIFIDAAAGAGTRGEAGAEIAFGPRVGPATLERLLCEGTCRVVAVASNTPVATTSATQAIPRAIRRFVVWRDGGCVIAGCRSRYRLQPHHIIHRSQGGDNHADNLASLCWYHHHVTIHGNGFRLDPDSPPQRRSLLPPPRGPDPGG
jgi:hypothetical protein